VPSLSYTINRGKHEWLFSIHTRFPLPPHTHTQEEEEEEEEGIHSLITTK